MSSIHCAEPRERTHSSHADSSKGADVGETEGSGEARTNITQRLAAAEGAEASGSNSQDYSGKLSAFLVSRLHNGATSREDAGTPTHKAGVQEDLTLFSNKHSNHIVFCTPPATFLIDDGWPPVSPPSSPPASVRHPDSA